MAAWRSTIDAHPPRDRRDAQPLPMKIQDHDKLPKLDHRLPLPPIGRDHRTARRPASRGAPREAGCHTWGIFKRRFWGEALRQRQTSTSSCVLR
jgi:hypothetical protein